VRSSALPLLSALVLATSGCATLVDQAEDLRSGAGELDDQARFCLAVTRALTSLDGGSSTDEASAAAEEVLTRVPDELRDDAEVVAEHLRVAEEAGDRSVLEDPEFRDAAERLRDDTRELCDPTA
jgi:hypothetical protein